MINSLPPVCSHAIRTTLMVWVCITLGFQPRVIRTQTINIFSYCMNKQGITNSIAFVFAYVVGINWKTFNLSPMADDAITRGGIQGLGSPVYIYVQYCAVTSCNYYFMITWVLISFFLILPEWKWHNFLLSPFYHFCSDMLPWLQHL